MAPPPLAKRIKRAVRYRLVRAALGAVAWVPLDWAARLGRQFGDLAFVLARKERAKALRSLERALPERSSDERVQIARRCFQHLGQAAFELACVAQLDRRIETYVEWPAEDRTRLEAALARGKGVVFVTGHVGNWELLARRVALAGYPAWAIAKETSDPRLTALVERFRAEGKVRSIWRGQDGAAKQMLRALRQGDLLGLLIDQDTRVQSVFVPFFGDDASTPRAAADLVLRTGAALMVGFCQRRPEGGYRLTMRELPVTQTADKEADAIALTAQATREIERAIREAPEQWVWMHQRWKTRPAHE